MRNSKLRAFLIALMLLVFAAGLAFLLYPSLWGAAVDQKISLNAQGFLNRDETAPTIPDVIVTVDSPTESEETRDYPELWADMVRYNETIYTQGQAGLSCEYDYQKPSFRLSDYGLGDEVFGVISIPAMELEMPIFLGATEQHMADGAAHLSQTSLPIGGENTNCVIAGHRGYNGASYFRYIDKLKVGDLVSVTNLWETLTYRVCEIKIIDPHDVTEILIQPGRELLTLLTCHPYTQNYQRYLVRAELSDEEQEQSREEDLEEAEKTFDASARTVVSIDENGSQQQIQVEPVSIQPVEEEGAENGASYSNQVILLEKYVPPVVLVLLALLLVFKLLRKRRKEQS